MNTIIDQSIGSQEVPITIENDPVFKDLYGNIKHIGMINGDTRSLLEIKKKEIRIRRNTAKEVVSYCQTTFDKAVRLTPDDVTEFLENIGRITVDNQKNIRTIDILLEQVNLDYLVNDCAIAFCGQANKEMRFLTVLNSLVSQLNDYLSRNTVDRKPKDIKEFCYGTFKRFVENNAEGMADIIRSPEVDEVVQPLLSNLKGVIFFQNRSISGWKFMEGKWQYLTDINIQTIETFTNNFVKINDALLVEPSDEMKLLPVGRYKPSNLTSLMDSTLQMVTVSLAGHADRILSIRANIEALYETIQEIDDNAKTYSTILTPFIKLMNSWLRVITAICVRNRRIIEFYTTVCVAKDRHFNNDTETTWIVQGQTLFKR